MRVPVVRIQNPHGPRSGPAPGGGFAVFIPNADFPEDFLEGVEVFGERNLNGFVGNDFAAVPKVGAVMREDFFGRGGEDFVGGLFLAARLAGRFPGQPGIGGVHAGGVGGMIAAQFNRGERGGGAVAGNDGEAGKGFDHGRSVPVNGRWKQPAGFDFAHFVVRVVAKFANELRLFTLRKTRGV